MRKHLVISITAILMAIVSLSSCSNGTDIGRYIPADAMMVMDLDMNSLWNKADIDNINQLSFVKIGRQELRSENPQIADMVDAIMKDPTSTGLHLKRDFALWITPSNNDVDGAVIATMHSKKKFEEFLNKYAADNDLSFKFADRDGWRVAKTENEPDNKINVLFNSDVAILAFDKKGVAKTINLKNSESLAGNKYFRQYWKERSEMSFWMSMAAIMDLAESNGEDVKDILSSIYGDEYWNEIANSSVACNVVFDKGVARTVFNYQGIKSKTFEKYIQKFNGDLVDYMPGTTYAAMSVAYNLKEIAKALESQKELDIDLDEEVMDGITIRETLSAFGGSALFDLFDLAIDDKGSLSAMFAVALDVKKADVVRKLLDESGLKKIQDDIYSLDGLLGLSAYIYLNDKALFVSNSGEVIQNFREGKHKGAMTPVAKKVKAGNYLYADLDINHYPDDVKALLPQNAVSLLGKYFDYTEFKTNSTESGEWDLFIKDKSQNSLLATLHFVDDHLVELGKLTDEIGSGNGSCPVVTEEYYVDDEEMELLDDDTHIF